MNTFNEAELAVIIDRWYLEWKDNIVDRRVPHRFGFAKEDLKRQLAESVVVK